MRHNINREGNSYRVTDGTTVRYAETWRASPAHRRRASDVKVYDASGELVRTIKSRGTRKPRKPTDALLARIKAENIERARLAPNPNRRERYTPRHTASFAPTEAD
jgi:hypothetical protein